MTIQNISFMCGRHQRAALLEWLRGTAVPGAAAYGEGLLDVTLAEVVEVPGEADFASQACSIALQLTFEDASKGAVWADTALGPMLESYRRELGAEAVAFRTVLKRLSL